MKYKIQFLFIMLFVKLIRIFPEKSRFAFADFLGGLGYKLIKSRKMTTLANLKLAFPEMTEKRREEIGEKSFRIMTKAFMSTLWFDTYFKDEKNVIIHNQEVIDSIMDRKKGAIIAAMHMGNMEATLKLAQKYTAVTVAKKQKNPYLDRFITESREKFNITLLKRSKKTAGELVDLLHQNKIIGLFSDHRDEGTTVEFFGETTIAPTGAVSLALKNDVPLVFIYNILKDDNTCEGFISDEIKLVKTGNFKEDVHTNVQNLISEMEEIIKKHPEQWMWFHDRWNISKNLKRNAKK
ncbi:MAG: lysophospholipid acyltransferase family protein [Fusobacteriaceae bacterium]